MLFNGDVFGIRQDDSKLFSCFPGIALSPRRSVSANLSAKNTKTFSMDELVAKFLGTTAANTNAVPVAA